MGDGVIVGRSELANEVFAVLLATAVEIGRAVSVKGKAPAAISGYACFTNGQDSTPAARNMMQRSEPNTERITQVCLSAFRSDGVGLGGG
jgi:hypothetical protein